MQTRPRSAVLLTALLVGALCAGAPGARGADAAPSVAWPTSGWRTATPEEQGVSSAALVDLIDFGERNAMDSVLLVRHGKLVLEAYYAPFQPGMRHAVNSVTKAVVGTLAGIAAQEGALPSLEAPVLGFFPERQVANLDANKKAMTLQSLLDSTSGLDWREPLSDEPPESMLQMERSRDWVGFVLDRPMAQAPGVGFNYDSGTWHLVSAILAKQTGLDTQAYAQRKLFAPLGIRDVAWRHDPQGVASGGYGLYLQPRDMAKIGYLYLNHGEWEGRQVLPRAWVDRAFNPTVPMNLATLRYAGGWWTLPEKHAHMAVGFLRQLIVVLPEIDAVAVTTGRAHYPLSQWVDLVVRAAKSPDPLPADAAAGTRLAERIAEARIEKRTPVGPASNLASAISGKTYRLAANWRGIQALRLDLASPEPRYEVTLASAAPGGPARRVAGPIGLDGTFRLRDAQGLEPLFAVKGTWLDENRFQMISRSLLDGLVVTWVMSFDGTHVQISLQDNSGVRLQMQGEASAE